MTFGSKKLFRMFQKYKVNITQRTVKRKDFHQNAHF